MNAKEEMKEVFDKLTDDNKEILILIANSLKEESMEEEHKKDTYIDIKKQRQYKKLLLLIKMERDYFFSCSTNSFFICSRA